jgi:hypothetical protein
MRWLILFWKRFYLNLWNEFCFAQSGQTQRKRETDGQFPAEGIPSAELSSRERNTTHWKVEIVNFRNQINWLLEESPSLN